MNQPDSQPGNRLPHGIFLSLPQRDEPSRQINGEILKLSRNFVKKKRVDFHLQNAYNICQTQQLLNTYDSRRRYFFTVSAAAPQGGEYHTGNSHHDRKEANEGFCALNSGPAAFPFPRESRSGHRLQQIQQSGDHFQPVGIDKYQTAKVLAAMEERDTSEGRLILRIKARKAGLPVGKGKEAANSLKGHHGPVGENHLCRNHLPQEEQVLEQIMGKIVGNEGV